MIRGTTPTFTLTIGTPEQVDLSLAMNIYVTIKQGTTEIELSGDALDVQDNVISCYLTQEQSLELVENNSAKIQVNWTYDSAGTVKRAATIVKGIQIHEQLLRRVIT